MPNTQNNWTLKLRDHSVLGLKQHLDAPAISRIPTIVLVDRSSNTPNIAELLKKMGYRVRPGRDAPTYADEIRSINPDIFLYATDSAERTTWDTLQAIRSDPDLPFVPMILYVHRISPSDRRRARFLNVADCLSMPFDVEDIVAAIANVLSREQSLRRQQQLFEDQLRHQILGLVQHEFRTPLTFLMGYTEYLRDVIDDNPDPEEIRLSLEGILEGSHRLHYLTESLILLTDLLQRDISHEEVCPIEPMDLWREALNTLTDLNTDERDRIGLVSPNETHQVIGAPELICEALVRLLDTSIHQPTIGKSRINLSLAISEDMVGWRIHIEGVNVAGQSYRQVVQPFSIDNAVSPLPGTLGLGLAVVEQVARMHGGNVTQESIEGEGAFLTMWLPLTPLPHIQPDPDII